MLHRILAACLAAGLVAGLLCSLIQEFTTTPLILKAETYEVRGEPDRRAAWPVDRGDLLILAHGDEAHGNAAVTAQPLERKILTAITTTATAVGFALMLVAAMILSGEHISARTGLAWGAAAFVVTGLAPALGLSPELPGSAAADLEARQIWWFATAIATGVALFLMIRVAQPLAIALGVALICLPHIVGAPHAEELTSRVPAELAAEFVSASLAVHAVLWALIGAVAGMVWQVSEPGPAAT